MTLSNQFSVMACSLMIFISSPSAHAAEVVDQDNIAVAPAGGSVIYQVFGSAIPTFSTEGPAYYQSQAGQFVTAGVSGLLSGVDLQLIGYAADTTSTFELLILSNVAFDDAGFVRPTFNVLGTLSDSVSSLQLTGGVRHIDTSGLGVSFNAGDQFTISVRSSPGVYGAFGIGVGTSPDPFGAPFNPANFISNPYSGGVSCRSIGRLGDPNPGAFGCTSITGLGFRTYVISVPEPATWAMLALGFGLIGFSLRRRRGVAMQATPA